MSSQLWKRIFGWGVLVALYIAACAILILPGCASVNAAGQVIEKHQDSAALIVGGATLAYLEQTPVGERVAVAKRIIEVVQVLDVALAGEDVTLQRLAQLAIERLPADTPPARKAFAIEFVSALQRHLASNVGAGGLTSDTRLTVAGLLERVRVYASLYASS